MDEFGLFGVVKETGVDDEGLKEFHDDYFPFPLFKDADLTFYEAFGKKTIFSNVGWSALNPFKLWREMKQMSKRFKESNIEGNMVGEGLVTGGVIIFDKNGEQKFMYEEITGTPFEMDDIASALKAIRDMEGVTGERQTIEL